MFESKTGIVAIQPEVTWWLGVRPNQLRVLHVFGQSTPPNMQRRPGLIARRGGKSGKVQLGIERETKYAIRRHEKRDVLGG